VIAGFVAGEQEMMRPEKIKNKNLKLKFEEL